LSRPEYKHSAAYVKIHKLSTNISIMALQAAYKQFLVAPNPTLLADDASFHYITTLTTVNGSAEIISHLNKQSRHLKKKEQKFLNAIESPNGLAVEVETTIEFLNGGGAYLPGLDDNFLADRTVTFPIVCMAGWGLMCVVLTRLDNRFTLSALIAMARSNRRARPGTKAPSSSSST
jgi:hypothetical protein